jgi:hypothetical protein
VAEDGKAGSDLDMTEFIDPMQRIEELEMRIEKLEAENAELIHDIENHVQIATETAPARPRTHQA